MCLHIYVYITISLLVFSHISHTLKLDGRKINQKVPSCVSRLHQYDPIYRTETLAKTISEQNEISKYLE